MLRDRIVCIIQNEEIQQNLLYESNITLVRTSEIAISLEAAARNAVDLKTYPGSEVQKLKISVQRTRENENAK